MAYRGMQCEMVPFSGHNGDRGEAYYARPTAPGRYGSVILIHHMPGWDEYCVEATRKLAHHGFLGIDPNLYFRHGEGEADDIAARARAVGGVPDDQVIGDMKGCVEFLRSRPESNGKVAMMGFCSGGRHAWLTACLLPGIDALVDCWGGNIIVDDPKALTPFRPVAPIDYTDRLACPVLGIFGNEDHNPTPDQVNRTEAELKRLGKSYEFHRYDGAGHGFFPWSRPAYRQAQAMDGWEKVLDFLHRHVD